jgi:hypothetical protein
VEVDVEVDVDLVCDALIGPEFWACVAGAYINIATTSAAASAAATAIRPPLPNPFIAALIYQPSRWFAFSLPDTSSEIRTPHPGSSRALVHIPPQYIL